MSPSAEQTERARLREKRKSWRSVGRQLPLTGPTKYVREAHNTGFDHGWARSLGEASGIWASVLSGHHIVIIEHAAVPAARPLRVVCSCKWSAETPDAPKPDGVHLAAVARELWIEHVIDEVVKRA